MKYSIIILSVIFLTSSQISCGGKVPRATPTSETDTLGTMVAATLTAIPSATTAPTLTIAPSATASATPTATIVPTQTIAPSETPSSDLLGKYIAFCTVDESHNATGLRLINADGTNLRPLPLAFDTEHPIPECMLAFSPNGKYLASVQVEKFPDNTRTDNLVIYDVVSGEIINITKDGSKRFSWSPDGNSLIHVHPNAWNGRWVASNTGFWFLDVLTGEDSQPFPPLTDFVIGDVSWSPDGSHLGVHRIQYEGLGEFGTLNSDGTQFKQWEARVGYFSWSPDGQRIVYDKVTYFSGEPSGLFISNVDESQTVTLFSGEENIGMSPRWSPDGGNILFVKIFLGTMASEKDQYWIISPDGRQMRQLVLSGIDGDVNWAAWGPDSKHIVMSTNNTTKIYVISLEGAQPLYIAEGIGAVWMP